jgi:hypothetical protein
MPNINLIPAVLFEAMQPYHFQYDNLPLQAILDRLGVVNSAVDNDSQQIRESVGTQGTLANRLTQSINDDGSLKTDAVDATLHSIEEHTDGATYVRMTDIERDKLVLISENATALAMQFDTGSTIVLFEDEVVEFLDSATVTWTVTAPNKVKANMAWPEDAAHLHFYGMTPVAVGGYQNYKTTSISTPFMEDTLRVFINGIAIFSDDDIYVPDSTHTTWTLTSFTPNYTAGTFALSRAIDASDIIRIDFDTDF